jgi:cell division protein FtsL
VSRGQAFGLALLALAVIASGIGVVQVKYESRTLFVELQQARAERDRLAMEWGRLQLELATSGSLGRVMRLAESRLGMRPPTPDRIVVVR